MSSLKLNDRYFKESAKVNRTAYEYYFDRLYELSISMFEWKNLPDEIDPRFLELQLFEKGRVVFFRDENLSGDGLNEQTKGYITLPVNPLDKFDIYLNPTKRSAVAYNGYQNHDLDENNSVVIYNNMLRRGNIDDIDWYAKKLANIDRTIDTNVNAQKTPIMVIVDENQRLTMKNLIKQYDGNEMFIFGNKNIDLNQVKSLKTDAPYVADRLYSLKTDIWNEALTYLGINNVNINKKERLIVDEVNKNNADTIASRYGRLSTRQKACKQINDMFNLNVSVSYREETYKQGNNLDNNIDKEGDDLE